MFMNQNLLSIITPVYQVEQYLPQCLDSILAQTYPHWELILVDDGSKDRSGEICEEYAKCASAHLQGEDRRRLLQSREFIRKTAKILQKMDVSPMKKCSLPVIGMFPCATFRVAVKFRGLLEKYL